MGLGCKRCGRCHWSGALLLGPPARGRPQGSCACRRTPLYSWFSTVQGGPLRLEESRRRPLQSSPILVHRSLPQEYAENTREGPKERAASKKWRKKGPLGLFYEPPRLLENIGIEPFALINCPLWPHSSHNARPLEGGPAGRDPRTELMLHGCEGPARPYLPETKRSYILTGAHMLCP